MIEIHNLCFLFSQIFVQAFLSPQIIIWQKLEQISVFVVCEGSLVLPYRESGTKANGARESVKAEWTLKRLARGPKGQPHFTDRGNVAFIFGRYNIFHFAICSCYTTASCGLAVMFCHCIMVATHVSRHEKMSPVMFPFSPFPHNMTRTSRINMRFLEFQCCTHSVCGGGCKNSNILKQKWN